MVGMPRRVLIAEGCFIMVGWHDPLALVFMSLECPRFSHLVRKAGLQKAGFASSLQHEGGPNVIDSLVFSSQCVP